jgi:hypothetical protein
MQKGSPVRRGPTIPRGREGRSCQGRRRAGVPKVPPAREEEGCSQLGFAKRRNTKTALDGRASHPRFSLQ